MSKRMDASAIKRNDFHYNKEKGIKSYIDKVHINSCESNSCLQRFQQEIQEEERHKCSIRLFFIMQSKLTE